jgi:hypothetical protein
MFKVQNQQEVHYWDFDVDFYINGEFARVNLTDEVESDSINIHKLVFLIMKRLNHISTYFEDRTAYINLVSDDDEVILHLEFNILENKEFLESLGFREPYNIWQAEDGSYCLEEALIFENLPKFLEHFIKDHK